ncbi:MAG: flagellar basal body P-ring protein FlgI [Fimbriimonadaceae bacterium]|jgi:flagellar P-ring protein precursor FlgI|nr:flagellar basal body P-ring protein FlgI [Fimbriimonadaceae bacterium]
MNSSINRSERLSTGLIAAGVGLLLLALSPFALAQADQTKKQSDPARQKQWEERDEKIRQAETEGIAVKIEQIGGFRGARSNTIVGYGLVVGLNGTGDSSVPVSNTVLANALTRWGTTVDEKAFKAKNIALVSVTAELPPFAAPGRKIDVTVQSIGDAKNLEGGVLLPTPLGPMGTNTTYVIASGSLNTGGFSASAGGSSSRKNHPTVGRISGGGDIQQSVQTQFVFSDNTFYLDLDQPDFTTSRRTAEVIRQTFPEYTVTALDGVTVSIKVPLGTQPVQAMSQILNLTVMANTPATVVINSRTGTIVMGGNVKLAPVVITYGALRISVESEIGVSQPGALSGGTTVAVQNDKVSANEDRTEFAVIPPNATLNDLARILQALNLSARDIINIFETLSQQGALKARVISQ